MLVLFEFVGEGGFLAGYRDHPDPDPNLVARKECGLVFGPGQDHIVSEGYREELSGIFRLGDCVRRLRLRLEGFHDWLP